MRSSERFVGVQEGLAEAARDAQQLVAVLVADPQRHRHRHDPAEDRGPEDIDELLVVGEEQDQLVAAPRPQALQVVEDAERPLVQFREGDVVRIMLALHVGDAARHGAVGFEHLDEGGDFFDHRRSNFMCSG